MPEESIAQTPWRAGDLVRYKGSMGSDFTARLTKQLVGDSGGFLGSSWEGRIKKIKRRGGNLESGSKPGDTVTLFERGGYCTKVAHAKLDAEKRDALIRQLESDVVTLMDERDRAERKVQVLGEVARDRRRTISNLQAKVSEQAAELEKKAGWDKLTEQVTWKKQYDRLKADYDREVQNGRRQADFWQEKLVKAEAELEKAIQVRKDFQDDLDRVSRERDTFKTQAADWEKWGKRENALVYREREKLDAIRKLVQDLEGAVNADLNPKLYHHQDTLSDKLGVYESAAASIKRGFATKRILDRLKEALGGEVGPNVTVEYVAGEYGAVDTTVEIKAEPQTRYWSRVNASGPETFFRQYPHCAPEFWSVFGGIWKKTSLAPAEEGFTEISASDLPEGVTP